MVKSITYDNAVDGNGRNGTFKCKGVEVIRSAWDSPTVLIAAMNSTKQGVSNSCWFEVPVEKINGLIAMLQEAGDLKG